MLVKVVNDNVHPYTEKYRGQVIHIPAKGSITMDQNEAAHFLGVNPGTAQVDANGIQKPESYKMLRIESLSTTPVQEPKKFICMKDGREFQTQAQLDKHILENYMDDMIDEEAKKKLTSKKTVRRKRGLDNDSSANSDGGEAKV